MRRFIYATLSLLLTTLSSCSKSSSITPGATSSTLHINLPEEPVTMDPRKGGDSYSCSLHFLLFDGLTRITEKSSGDHGIADRVDLSEDKLTYTFHLREAKWSNGLPITAYDFAYSWKSMLDPSFPAPNANMLYPILNAEEAKKGLVSVDAVGVTALDEKTLVVTLKTPTPYFLNLTSFCAFFPVCKEVAQNHPEWADKASPLFTCSGPYTLTEWKHGNEFLLDKNSSHWDIDNISVDKIHISLVKDENTVLELFDQGKLDLVGMPFTNISVDAAETLCKKGLLEACPVGRTLICSFNVHHPILSNLNIRQALSKAIDREAIASSVGVLGDSPALNFVPPALKRGKNIPLIEPMNAKEARAHLQAGLQELGLEVSDLEKITLIYPIQERARSVVQILQENWMKHLGVKIELQSVTFKDFLTSINQGNFDICHFYWLAQYDDPMNILDRFRYKTNPKNYSKWENQEYIDLLEASAMADKDEREQLLQQAEELIMRELPIAPIIHTSILRMKQPYVQNLQTFSIGFTPLQSIHLEPHSVDAKEIFKKS